MEYTMSDNHKTAETSRLISNDSLLKSIKKPPFNLETNEKSYVFSLIIYKNFQAHSKCDGTFLPVSVLGNFYPPLMQSIKLEPFPDPLHPDIIYPVGCLINYDGTIKNLSLYSSHAGQFGSVAKVYDKEKEAAYFFEIYPGNIWEMHSNIVYAFVFMEVKSEHEANLIFRSMWNGKLRSTTFSMRYFLESFLL